MWLWAVETTALRSRSCFWSIRLPARRTAGWPSIARMSAMTPSNSSLPSVSRSRTASSERRSPRSLTATIEHEPAQERLGLVGPELVAAVVAVHDEHLGQERRVVGRVERPLADQVERVESAVPDGAPTDRTEQAGVGEPERVERDDVVAEHAGPVARGQREVLALGVGDQDRAGVVEQVRHDGPDALAGARRRDGEHVARPVVAKKRAGLPLSVPRRPIDGVAGLGGRPPSPAQDESASGLDEGSTLAPRRRPVRRRRRGRAGRGRDHQQRERQEPAGRPGADGERGVGGVEPHRADDLGGPEQPVGRCVDDAHRRRGAGDDGQHGPQGRPSSPEEHEPQRAGRADDEGRPRGQEAGLAQASQRRSEVGGVVRLPGQRGGGVPRRHHAGHGQGGHERDRRAGPRER